MRRAALACRMPALACAGGSPAPARAEDRPKQPAFRCEDFTSIGSASMDEAGVVTMDVHTLSPDPPGGDKLLRVFLDEVRAAREGETIEAYRSDLFSQAYLPKVKPFPGVRVLLQRIRAEGQAVALGSSGKKAEVEHYRDILGITDLVDAVTSSDDADRSKPDPDIFDAVLAKLPGVSAGQALVVGDTPYDAQAAGKIGLSTIGMLCGGFAEVDLYAAGCIALYRDPQDLLDGFDRSPLVSC